MKALIITFGSTGDVYPMLGLATALQAAGHEVCLATAQLFAQEIEHENIPFYALPPDWDLDAFKAFTQKLSATDNQLKQFGLIYDKFGPFIDTSFESVSAKLQDFDILISTYLFPFFSSVAEAQHKPFVTVAFCHNTVPRWDRPPENIVPLTWLPRTWQRQWNYLAWRLADRVLSQRIKRSIQRFSTSIRPDTIRGFLFEPSEQVLVASSKAWMQGAEPLDKRFHMIGYLRHQPPETSEGCARLDAFCQGQPVPILTFGSMTAHDVQTQLNHFLSNWPKDRKLIIQAGWADLKTECLNENTHILMLEKHPHNQLFPYASVVVHHGGAGTTASVLHTAKPHIIIPHLGDQYFWASEVVTHGLGLKLKYKQWSKKLCAAIEHIEQNECYQQRANTFAETIRKEPGGQNAVRLLEEILNEFQPE